MEINCWLWRLIYKINWYLLQNTLAVQVSRLVLWPVLHLEP